MKKFLLTASMLMMGVVATFAQNWEVGQEITGKIGNPSFTEDDKAPWNFDYSGGNPTSTGGVCELYSGANADVYQYIELPAGMYTLECQGYYRIGSGWDFDPKTYGTEAWEDNAMLYVQNGKYNVESNEFTAGRTFKTPLMPRLFDASDTQIYVGPKDGEDGYPGWDMSDNDCTGQGWGWAPASIPGSLKYFEAGKYMPVDDGDNKYNTVTFFLTEDGYVRIGVSKTKASDADSFMATNFKLFYAGEAGEAAELMALQEEVDDLWAQLEKLKDSSTGFLNGILEDKLIELAEYSYSSEMDKEECAAAKDVLFALLQNAKTAQGDLASLNSAIKAIDVLATTTDYPGLAALNRALDDAKASISEEYVYDGKEDWATYSKLTDALYAARIEYLKSSPKTEAGAWDFSPFIANRFFTNEENNPTWDEDTNFWKYATWPEAWGDNMEFDGNNQEQKDARSVFSGDVVLSGSDDTVPFKWYKTGSGGPGWEVYYDHHMTSCKAWAPTPTSGVSVIGQYLKGLPNGFYSLTGMAESWTNEGVDAIDTHFIIRTAETSSRSERAEPRAWWNNNSTASWNILSTDMIEVKDGDLWVEASTNGFYSITGFQLFYYGETPDFNALIKPSLDKAKEAAAALAWEGDQKNAEDILKKIPASINDKESYLAATETIAQANDYINKANAAVNNWKGIQNFTELSAKYDEGSVEASIIATALDATMELGEGDNDVYEAAIANNEQYNAYASYMGYREAIGEFIKDPLVAPVVEEQNAYLTKTFATPEKLDEFKKAIGVPYNQAKFAADGIDKATLDNAKDATFLLINPTFDEGCEKGWTVVGTGAATNNEYSFDDEGNRTNAELWNRPEFTFSQTVNGLPAGTYEFRVRALYRDGGGVNKQQVDAYNAAGGEEEWANHNAVLFAKSSDNEWDSYIKGIESLKATENSFTQCGTKWETDELDGSKYPIEFHFMNGTLDESEQKEEFKYTGHNEGDYPFDVKVSLGMDEETLTETVYYYPASMQGFYAACKKDPTAFANSVIFYLSEAGNVELGIRKDAAIGNDWVIMDDFELYYLGKEAPTAIDEVAGAEEGQGAVEYYSINGVKLSAPQQGINIVKYANGQVKKVFIK